MSAIKLFKSGRLDFNTLLNKNYGGNTAEVARLLGVDETSLTNFSTNLSPENMALLNFDDLMTGLNGPGEISGELTNGASMLDGVEFKLTGLSSTGGSSGSNSSGRGFSGSGGSLLGSSNPTQSLTTPTNSGTINTSTSPNVPTTPDAQYQNALQERVQTFRRLSSSGRKGSFLGLDASKIRRPTLLGA